jgi:hypothetical protein
MADDFSSLFAPPDKQAALLAALRRQRAAGNLGMLTGDPVLGNFGASQVRQAEIGDALQGREMQMAEANRLNEERTRAYMESVRAATEAQAGRGQRDDERLALEREREARKAAEAKAKASALPRTRAAGAPKGKTLPTTTIEGLAELPTAEAQVDALVETFNRLNMGGAGAKMGSAATDMLGLQSTDSAEYNAAAKLAMQAAGKILEGGKLAAGDEVKYKAMLPRAGDPTNVVKQKADGMKAFLRDLATRRARGLKASGYNVPDELIPGAGAAAGASGGGAPVRMRFPDGTEADVPPEKVDLAKRKGGVPAGKAGK